ncbi:hypothetical protein ACWEG1_06110 [Streptomyces bauhiniae]
MDPDVSGQWLGQQASDIEYHVLPLDDLIVHEHAPSCSCGPTPRVEARDDRPDAWIYKHHSLDGREFNEPDYQS